MDLLWLAKYNVLKPAGAALRDFPGCLVEDHFLRRRSFCPVVNVLYQLHAALRVNQDSMGRTAHQPGIHNATAV
jgi:hypothetical protein